ncbi:MAG: hypothetical protein GQ559_07135 [Desulfobulbaceae bacterium]|nr:hypothetical protein [Desulfobulbaceae bacterium]
MKIASHLPNIGLSQFYQLPFNVRLTKGSPHALLRLYLYFLGMFYFILQRKDRIKIVKCLNFVLRYRLTFSHFCRNVIQTFCGIFEHYLEKLLMGHRNFAEMQKFLGSRLTVQNRHVLDQAAAQGRGGILVTGHFGAVEYLPLALALNGYKIAMIVKFKTDALRRQLMKRAAELDIILIDAEQEKVAFKALDAIKQGRLLITECDEFSKWIRHKSEKVSVFGNIVSRDKTLDFFYRRAKVPAMLGLMKRRNGGFVLSITSLANGCEKVSLSKRAWDCLEEHILAEPYQWYQWKDAAVELAPFIADRKTNEDKQTQGVPARDPVFIGGQS